MISAASGHAPGVATVARHLAGRDSNRGATFFLIGLIVELLARSIRLAASETNGLATTL